MFQFGLTGYVVGRYIGASPKIGQLSKDRQKLIWSFNFSIDFRKTTQI